MLQEQVSVGVFEGPEEYMFGRVGAIAVTPSGELLVLDRQVPAIRKYSADGTYVSDIGREGGGPGEFRQPEAMNVLPDGRILVRDPGNGRITVFNPDGSWSADWRLPSGGTWSTSEKLYVDTAGNAYTYILLDIQADITDWRYGLARYTPEGVLVDTIAYPTWDYEEHTVVARREGSSSSRRVPFTPEVVVAFSPLGYMVGGVSDDYRIALLRRVVPRLRIERAYTPVPVSDEEADERVRHVTRNLQRNYPGWRWDGPAIPEHKPAFRDILVADDGRLWVHVPQPGEPFRSEAAAAEEEERTGRPQLRYREPAAFDVFEPDGRYLGRVEAPTGFRTGPEPVIRGDTVWAIVFDELDVATVVRFGIARGR
ncbi:MAG: 6-bladed beta-propeller [Gemmatimonadales bacterium]